MPSPTPIQDHPCVVVHNRECGTGLKRLRLRVADHFDCLPGQFVMLDLPTEKFYFRRPFSVLNTQDAQELDIYYKVVGTGTRMMWELAEGDTLQCLGPLGNSFTPPSAPQSALYIGGGIGIAPMYLLGKQTAQGGHCFYGVRSQNEIGLAFELLDIFGEQVYISTDDGSSGLQGNVCDLLNQKRDLILSAQEAYVCGPTRMMEAVVRLLNEIKPDLRIETSLEEHMPCGTGACTGCVVPRADQALPSKVCVEGPVFNARAIRWGGPKDSDAAPLNEFCEESPCPL